MDGNGLSVSKRPFLLLLLIIFVALGYINEQPYAPRKDCQINGIATTGKIYEYLDPKYDWWHFLRRFQYTKHWKHEIRYSYQDKNGVAHNDNYPFKANVGLKYNEYQVGNNIDIKYLKSNPQYSCLTEQATKIKEPF